jgi:hypothetical protein
MPQAKSEAIRLMNEQYEIIWTIANSPDSQRTAKASFRRAPEAQQSPTAR